MEKKKKGRFTRQKKKTHQRKRYKRKSSKRNEIHKLIREKERLLEEEEEIVNYFEHYTRRLQILGERYKRFDYIDRMRDDALEFFAIGVLEYVM